MTPARERLPELDAMRGIAAVMVVFYHSLITLQLSHGALSRLLDTLPTHPMFAGRLAVIFFFVLSGAVLTRSLMSATPESATTAFVSFAAQRLTRLCLPVAAVLAISVALNWLLWRGPWPGGELFGGWKMPPSTTGFVSQTLLIGADGDFYLDPVLWSLAHELRLSLLLPLLVLLPGVRGPRGSVTILLFGVLAYGASVAGETGIENTIQLGPTLPDTLRATGYFTLPFLAGAAMSLGAWESWRPDATTRKLGLVAALLLFCSDNDLAAVAGSVLLILLSRPAGGLRDVLRHPILLWLGRVSFSLYLIHMPVQFAVRHGMHDFAGEAWLELSTIILSLAAAWAVHRTVERPTHLLAKRIGLAFQSGGMFTVARPAGTYLVRQ